MNRRFWRHSITASLASVLVLIASAVSVHAASETSIDVAEIEGRILSARRHITSGEFLISVVSNDKFIPRLSYHIWFDGGTYLRQERTVNGSLQVSIYNEKSAIYYTGRPGARDNPNLTARPIIKMVPIREAPRDRPPFAICDPLVAMLVPVEVSLWPHEGLESAVKSTGRANIGAKPSTWNGLASIVVTFDMPRTGNALEYEVVPTRSYSIVRWRMRGTVPERGRRAPLESTVNCDLAQLGDATWFPHIIHLIEKWDGSVRVDESSTMQVVSTNRPADRGLFTIEGSHLPPTQLIVQSLSATNRTPSTMPAATTRGSGERPKPRPLLVWDGAQVRPLTSSDVVQRETSSAPVAAMPPAVPRRVPWGVLLLTGVGCASISAWILSTIRRKRHGV